MNRISITGFVASDADLRYTQTGKAVIHFSLAVRKGTKRDENGNYVKNFFDVEAWGTIAEIAEERIIKGAFVVIDGHLDNDLYEQDGKQKRRIKVVADFIEYMPGQKKMEKDSSNESIEESDKDENSSFRFDTVEDEEIPF